VDAEDGAGKDHRDHVEVFLEPPGARADPVDEYPLFAWVPGVGGEIGATMENSGAIVEWATE